MTLPAFFFHTQRVGGRLNACRIGTHANLMAISTCNESVTNAQGRPLGKAARKAIVKKGRAATGQPDRAGFNQGHLPEYHRAMYPGLPMPTLVETTDFPNLVAHADEAHLGKGHVIAIAVDLRAHAALRRFVSGAGHEIGIVARKTAKGRVMKVAGQRQMRIVDPAHAASDTYTGHWVPQVAVRKGAEMILGGIIVAELYPVRGWTREALLRSRKNTEIKALTSTIAPIRQARDRFKRERDEALSARDTLAQKLLDCEGRQPENAKAAGWEAALVRVTEQVQQLRTEGP